MLPAPGPWEEDASHWQTVSINGGVEEKQDYRRLSGHFVEEKHVTENDDDFEVHKVTTVSRRESLAASPQEEMVPDSADSRRVSPTFTRARLVTIPKRAAPALPPRHPRHTWGSGSSRESTSPTALSHSSHSTEPTEAAMDSEAPEAANEAASLPSNVKVVQTSTVLPAVVDEDELDESDSEILADKNEFLSAHEDDEAEATAKDLSQPEEHTLTEEPTLTEVKDDISTVDAEGAQRKDSLAPSPEIKPETTAEKEEPRVGEVLEGLHLEDKSPKVTSDAQADTESEKRDLSSIETSVA